MHTFLHSQYAWVKESREILLQYCAKLSDEAFVMEYSTFGRGSIRNLLVHNANIYEFWIGRQGLKKAIEFTNYASIRSSDEVVWLFGEVDKLMHEFLELIETDSFAEISITRNGLTQSMSPLKLFTHVITHEFHHKGQILSLSRHLGYTPVDTDIVR